MGVTGWAVENWFVLLQSIGIIGGLLFTAFTIRSDNKTRQVGNLLKITQSHRELWTQLHSKPELIRVLDPQVDVKQEPVIPVEETFVTLVILHVNSVHSALKAGLVIKPEGLQRDIDRFFSLPIPAAVWEKIKQLQDKDFVDYIETCLDSDADPT